MEFITGLLIGFLIGHTAAVIAYVRAAKNQKPFTCKTKQCQRQCFECYQNENCDHE